MFWPCGNGSTPLSTLQVARQRSGQSISVDQGRTKLCVQSDRPGGLNPVIQASPFPSLQRLMLRSWWRIIRKGFEGPQPLSWGKISEILCGQLKRTHVLRSHIDQIWCSHPTYVNTLKRMQVLVAFMMSMCGSRIALPRSHTLTHSHQLGAKQGKFHQRSDNFYCGGVDTGVRSLLVKSSRIEIVRWVFSPLQRPGVRCRP